MSANMYNTELKAAAEFGLSEIEWLSQPRGSRITMTAHYIANSVVDAMRSHDLAKAAEEEAK